MSPFCSIALIASATVADGRNLLDLGARAVADFRPAEALALLEKAGDKGPYTHTEYVKLKEQSAIAYAYLGREEDAQRMFELMLAIDPSHAISYVLSPKVTFSFERAREGAARRGAPAIDLRWPGDLSVGNQVPIDLEVVADPHGFLKTATLHARQKDGPELLTRTIALPKPGEVLRLWLPAIDADHPATVELYLIARDDRGNEVLEWSSKARPRELHLAYEPPDPWYGKWWVWTLVAGVVAAGTAGGVLAAKHEPSRRVDGTVMVQ
jgi:tetratricopeptide (TPR) repeat protein